MILPLLDKVIVLQNSVSDAVSPGGIIIPDTAKEKPQEGEVIAVGQGRRDDSGKRIAPDVRVGDSVLYSKYGGSEIQIDNVTYLIMSELDVLAITSRRADEG